VRYESREIISLDDQEGRKLRHPSTRKGYGRRRRRRRVFQTYVYHPTEPTAWCDTTLVGANVRAVKRTRVQVECTYVPLISYRHLQSRRVFRLEGTIVEQQTRKYVLFHGPSKDSGILRQSIDFVSCETIKSWGLSTCGPSFRRLR
jgi:hypothetical protein